MRAAQRRRRRGDRGDPRALKDELKKTKEVARRRAQGRARGLQRDEPVRFEGNNYSAEWLEKPRVAGSRTTRHARARSTSSPIPRRSHSSSSSASSTGDELQARHEISSRSTSRSIASRGDVPRASSRRTTSRPPRSSRSSRSRRPLRPVGQAGRRDRRKQLGARPRAARRSLRRARETAVDLRRCDRRGGHEAVAIAASSSRDGRACGSEADALETLVADELWPLPKYREMLLLRRMSAGRDVRHATDGSGRSRKAPEQAPPIPVASPGPTRMARGRARRRGCSVRSISTGDGPRAARGARRVALLDTGSGPTTCASRTRCRLAASTGVRGPSRRRRCSR